MSAGELSAKVSIKVSVRARAYAPTRVRAGGRRRTVHGGTPQADASANRRSPVSLIDSIAAHTSLPGTSRYSP